MDGHSAEKNPPLELEISMSAWCRLRRSADVRSTNPSISPQLTSDIGRRSPYGGWLRDGAIVKWQRSAGRRCRRSPAAESDADQYGISAMSIVGVHETRTQHRWSRP